MRLGFGLLAFALLAACSDDKAARLAADWRCGPVEGIKAISGERKPAWVLVGEFTETNEAPAAFAEIACNLAANLSMPGEKLFVGVSRYLGGYTNAETAMDVRLKALAAAGAPIVIQEIGGDDHPYAVHERSKTEKVWAAAITKMVADTGATRALLLVPRADAIDAAIPPTGDRFAGYSPMPTFLEGDVVSLEVATNPIAGATGPAIRINRTKQNGFDGQLALVSLTHPAIAVMMPEQHPRPVGSLPVRSMIPGADAQLQREAEEQAAAELQDRRANEILRNAQKLIDGAMDQGSLDVQVDLQKQTDEILKHLDDDLPKFQPE